jgi:peptide deformylase
VAILDLKYYGDEILRTVSAPVENIDGEMVKFAEDLIQTMIFKRGIGLAANQVGRAIRVFAVDPSFNDSNEKPFVLFNPEIIETEGEQTGEEGCLSFPGLFETLSRPRRVFVKAVDINGNTIKLEKQDLLARVLLHENDHLDAKLFVDYFSFLKSQLYNKRLKRLKAGEIEVFQ